MTNTSVTTSQRRKYDPEFKMKLVMSLLKGEASQQELSRRHDISATVISKWKDKFLEHGLNGLKQEHKDISRDERILELEREIERRDQVIGELTLACRLLKKGIFPG